MSSTQDTKTTGGHFIAGLHKSIQYYPLYTTLTGSFHTGILISGIISKLVHGYSVKLSRADILFFTEFSERQYKTAVDRIKDVPFIKQEYIEEEHRTLYTVDFDMVFDILQEDEAKTKMPVGKFIKLRKVQDRGVVRNRPGRHIYKINKLHSINKSGGSTEPSTPKKGERNQVYLDMAQKLADAISKNKKLNYKSSVARWATEIRKVVTKREATLKRAQRALKYYCFQLGLPEKQREAFLPDIQSGGTFYSKFDKIESSIDRWKKTQKESPKEIKLTKLETRLKKGMVTNWAGLERVDMDTMDLFIHKLYTWMERALEITEDANIHEKIKKTYLESFFGYDSVFGGYAMWMSVEVPKWKNWGGDLKLFHPEGPNFKKYITWRIKSFGYNVDQKLTEIINHEA